LDLARENWQELEEPVARGPWLVDVESDRLYVRRRGLIFEPRMATIVSGQGADLAFYVDPATGEPVILERVREPRLGPSTSRGAKSSG
jgi:hypothetical protein